MSFFDDLEIRSADQRARDIALALPAQIENAQKLNVNLDALGAVDASSIQTIDDLAQLPVLRKSDLVQAQSENGPLGGYGALKTHEFAHIFQSPGPIYEPGGVGHLGESEIAVETGAGNGNCRRDDACGVGVQMANAQPFAQGLVDGVLVGWNGNPGQRMPVRGPTGRIEMYGIGAVNHRNPLLMRDEVGVEIDDHAGHRRDEHELGHRGGVDGGA